MPNERDPRGGPATYTTTADHVSRCECESYGSCVACSDRRAEAWKYRRPLIELAKVAESIADERAVAEIADERRIAHQLVLQIWGGSAA